MPSSILRPWQLLLVILGGMVKAVETPLRKGFHGGRSFFTLPTQLTVPRKEFGRRREAS
jgi:hypothetical protein